MTHFTLHIGLHKTGTSTIQSFLSDKRDDLLKLGIDFPLVGRTPRGSQAHRHVAAWFRSQKSEYPPEFVQVMRKGLSDSPRCILSAEDLYFCNSEQIDKIAVAFDPDTHVICYLRDPVSHIFSMYKEKLKNPTDVSFGEFVEFYRHALDTDSVKSYYSFERNLGYWKNFFRVSVASYLKFGLVSDFLARCEISLPADAGLRVNVSPSDDALFYQLAIGRALRDALITKEEWRKLKNHIARADQTGKLPAADDYKALTIIRFDAFVQSFLRANPGLTDLAAGSSTALPFWDAEKMNHAVVVDMLRQTFSAQKAVAKRPRPTP